MAGLAEQRGVPCELPLGQDQALGLHRLDAVATHAGCEVAIKVLHRNLPFSNSMKERLQREARMAAALTHEKVCKYCAGGKPTRTSRAW